MSENMSEKCHLVGITRRKLLFSLRMVHGPPTQVDSSYVETCAGGVLEVYYPLSCMQQISTIQYGDFMEPEQTTNAA